MIERITETFDKGGSVIPLCADLARRASVLVADIDRNGKRNSAEWRYWSQVMFYANMLADAERERERLRTNERALREAAATAQRGAEESAQERGRRETDQVQRERERVEAQIAAALECETRATREAEVRARREAEALAREIAERALLEAEAERALRVVAPVTSEGEERGLAEPTSAPLDIEETSPSPSMIVRRVDELPATTSRRSSERSLRVSSGILDEMREVGIEVSDELADALDECQIALQLVQMAPIEYHLPILEAELERLPLQQLSDDLLRRLLGEVLQPLRERLARARRSWIYTLGAAASAVVLAIIGVSEPLAIFYGPLGLLLAFITAHRAHKLDQLHSTANALCKTASESLRMLPAGRAPAP